MPGEQNHYGVLGITETASEEEIRKAYKRLALACHPDRDKSQSAKSKFIAIKTAHRILSDKKLRADYDTHLSLQSFNLDDTIMLSEEEPLFGSESNLFGAHSNAAPAAQKPPCLDIFDSIDVTLNDLYIGAVRWLEVQRHIRCSEPDCVLQDSKCRSCSGRRLIDSKKRLKLEISAFHEPPSEYRFPGEGDESLDSRMPPGDVIIRPNIVPHTLYRRVGTHLVFDKQISAQDLLCGFIFELPPLDRRDWRFSLLDQVVNVSGFYAARGFGMFTGTGTQRGDLIVTFSLRVPRRLITEREDWLASWQELNRDDESYAVALEMLSESEYNHIFNASC